MNARNFSEKKLLDSCAEVRAEDGTDPLYSNRKGRSRRIADRKVLQLCAQVADTLNELLPECRNEVLQMLQVASVVPAPTANQLLVTVCPVVHPLVPLNAEEVQQAFAEALGWLRSEVAAAITRKRAPKLLFQFAATWSGEES